MYGSKADAVFFCRFRHSRHPVIRKRTLIGIIQNKPRLTNSRVFGAFTKFRRHGVVTVVGVAVLASSYVWGISQAKDWLSVSSNRKGNLFTVLGRASDALSEDMSKSPSNFLRDTVAAGTVIALAPLSAILLIL